MAKKDGKRTIKELTTWVAEAQWVAREWRKESWRDQEMWDGLEAQWTQDDWDSAVDAGIDPITINRTFPAVNLILGNEVINKFDMIAKGRTQDDSETGQVMTESIKFVMDQSEGEFLVSAAFKDQVIPGIGILSPALNSDPRQERIALKYRDWKEAGWDPYSGPWWRPDTCRYVYYQRWMDLEDLKALFFSKRKDIDEEFSTLANDTWSDNSTLWYDEANMVEELKRELSGASWVDKERKRVRPVEIWYPVNRDLMFATFPDGRAIEIREDMPPNEAYQAILASQQVVRARVKKMMVCSFLGQLELNHRDTPYPHDQYPLVPFVGYVDRWGFPFGVPRQIRGEDIEVNKRRSMALALLKGRRVEIESGVAKDDEDLKEIYEESQRVDGLVVVKDGALTQGRYKVVEHSQMSEYQIRLLEQSEREIQHITGSNAPLPEHQESGVAMGRRERTSQVFVSPLFQNLRRSMQMLGNQLIANVQGFWQAEKILRITDRMTGAERFVALNEKIVEGNNVIQIKNNITQGKYDMVVTEAPQTDTVRESNMNLIIEWVKKSPPEIIPFLMNMAFEMSNLPNKEMLMARIKPLLGVHPDEEKMSPEEIKQKVIQQLEQQKAAQAEAAAFEKKVRELQIQKETLEVQKLMAEIKNIEDESRIKKAETVSGLRKEKAETEGKVIDNIDKASGHLIKLDEATRASMEETKEGIVKQAEAGKK